MIRLWATRGHGWGFRFLINASGSDPLLEYMPAFAGLEGRDEAYRENDGQVSLRFPDPLGRRDRAGRVIPHEVLLDGEEALLATSFEDGVRLVWPLLVEKYADVYLADLP